LNGLDPHGIAEIRHLLIKLCKEEGKTIFVSSHLLSEIESIGSLWGSTVGTISSLVLVAETGRAVRNTEEAVRAAGKLIERQA
jgi:ABC-type multidrug transport system ATPase subunit